MLALGSKGDFLSSAGGVLVSTSADRLARFMRALAEGSHFQLLSGVLMESKGE